MRTSFLIAAAALVAAVACSKEENLAPMNQTGEKTDLTVTIANTAATKATGVTAANEDKISTLEIFVFNGDALDAYKKVSDGSNTATLSCTSGARSVYAIVNGEEDYSGITSKAALLAKSSQLSNNATNKFVMVGSKDVTLPQTETINIDVNRIAARVVIKKITSAFTGAQKDLDFTIDAIYLLNAVGEQSTLFAANASVADGATWYNKIKRATSGVDALIYDAVTSVNLKNAASSAVEHDFYCYPNPTVADANEGSWSARHTRLVIKATIGGTVYYYPLTMPAIQSNHSYEINEVIIKHLGNIDDPSDPTDGLEDTPVQVKDIDFQVTVKAWTPVIVSGEGETGGIWTI